MNLRKWYKDTFFVKRWRKHFHKKVVKEAKRGYAFDYGYLWELEYAKLKEMQFYFTTSDITFDDAKVASEINLTLNVMDIFMDKRDIDHVEGSFKTNEDGFIDASDVKIISDVYVNLKNVHRFTNDPRLIEFYKKHPAELYREKARHLYHKIRFEREQFWSN